MMNKPMYLALALALLLGGCSSGNMPGVVSVNHSADIFSRPTMPSSTVPTPSLAVLKEATPAPSAASPLCFSTNDMEQIRSYWPLRQRKIDGMGTLDDIGVILIGDGANKTLSIIYGFQTNIAFDDLCKDFQGYITGNWKTKKGVSAYVVMGKAEGSVDVNCTIQASAIMFAFTVSNRYDEAVNILDAHWPDNIIKLPVGFSAPYSEYISLSPGMMSCIREWKVPNSMEAFNQIAESVSGRTGFMHLNLKSNDIDDCITFRDGDVEGMVNVSKKLGKVSINYTVYSSPFPGVTPAPAQPVPVPIPNKEVVPIRADHT